MTFIQKILKEVHCPRCNAIAQERLEDREESVIIILWCDKCKLKRNLGITTRRALKLKKRQEKLKRLVSQERSPRTRARVLRQIALLDEEIRRAELGIQRSHNVFKNKSRR
jgi:transposase-like protein